MNGLKLNGGGMPNTITAAERGPDNLHSFSQCISEMELVGFVGTIY